MTPMMISKNAMPKKWSTSSILSFCDGMNLKMVNIFLFSVAKPVVVPLPSLILRTGLATECQNIIIKPTTSKAKPSLIMKMLYHVWTYKDNVPMICALNLRGG